MKKNLSQSLDFEFTVSNWRALSYGRLVATVLATTFLMGCKDWIPSPSIPSTRFGIIEDASFGSGRLYLIKDEVTKKQWLLCMNCTLTEYKEKK